MEQKYRALIPVLIHYTFDLIDTSDGRGTQAKTVMTECHMPITECFIYVTSKLYIGYDNHLVPIVTLI